jgi:hypothetical protein
VPEAKSNHFSDVRQFLADVNGEEYFSFASLDDARADPQGTVILDGDDGGQIYLAFPSRAINCSEATLDVLLHDLDSIAWPGNGDDTALVAYERHALGDGVLGGMGGGVVTPDGWVHPEFSSLGIEGEIRAVLSGVSPRLSSDALAVRRIRARATLWERLRPKRSGLK